MMLRLSTVCVKSGPTDQPADVMQRPPPPKKELIFVTFVSSLRKLLCFGPEISGEYVPEGLILLSGNARRKLF